MQKYITNSCDKKKHKDLKTTKGRNWDLKIRTKSKYDKIRHIVEVIVLEKNTTEFFALET